MMETPYHFQFRVIVIGDTMVGKSSLLKTFSEGSFGEMEPTVGVDFFSKIIAIKPKQLRQDSCSSPSSHHRHNLTRLSRTTTTDDNIIVKLQIWDTAGQERFKSIVTSYYRNSVGIILAYDVTNKESYDHIINWFDEARRHVEPSPSPTLSSYVSSSLAARSNGGTTTTNPLTSTPNATPSKLLRQQVRASEKSDRSSSSFDSTSGSNTRVTSNDTSTDSPYTTNFYSTPTSNFRSRRLPASDNYSMAYLILGCKTDLEEKRQVGYEDGKLLADSYGFKFIETSSKTNHNIEQAFQILAEEVYDRIIECGSLKRLYRTASGGHLTFDGSSSYMNEGIRIGPLIESSNKRFDDGSGVRLLEAQPVSGYLGGCC